MRTPPISLARVASQHHGQLPMSTVACAGAVPKLPTVAHPADLSSPYKGVTVSL